MIYIDFQPGQHGNFLEFVCNKFMAGLNTGDSPFNELGAAHAKTYKNGKIFSARHYYNLPDTNFNNDRIISITTTHDDLLPLYSISLLRCNDDNIDNDQLEINTYNKLIGHQSLKPMLLNIIDAYFQDHRPIWYNSMRQSDWPAVVTPEDFDSLPDHVLQKCAERFSIVKPELSASKPDCPRHILRECYKIWFKDEHTNGFLVTQKERMVYNSSNNVLYMPYLSFYTYDEFVTYLQRIAEWSNYHFEPSQEFDELYAEFLVRQPYMHIKIKCDELLQRIFDQEEFTIPPLTLLEESYMNACIEQKYNVEMPFIQPVWFRNSVDIFNHLGKK